MLNIVDMKVNTVIAVSNAENVELKIDNTLIFVTTKDLEKLRKEINDKIGNLSSLKTTDKSNVVAAINEIFLKFDDISTDAKGTSFDDTITELGVENVQDAIVEVFKIAKAAKEKSDSNEQELTGQVTRLNGINTELEAEIGNPV